MPKSKSKSKRPRYTAAQKKRVLETAKKEGLTGEQVAKKFGIAQLTFYRWRGPVRGKRGPGRPKGSGAVQVNEAHVRRQVRAEVRRMLPRIIREEVAAALRG